MASKAQRLLSCSMCMFLNSCSVHVSGIICCMHGLSSDVQMFFCCLSALYGCCKLASQPAR